MEHLNKNLHKKTTICQHDPIPNIQHDPWLLGHQADDLVHIVVVAEQNRLRKGAGAGRWLVAHVSNPTDGGTLVIFMVILMDFKGFHADLI